MTPDMQPQNGRDDLDTPTTAKRTPARRKPLDGAAARERGHDKHRRRCRPDMTRAQHAIIDRLIAVGEAWAPDFDDVLPAAESGSRTYIGTAFLDLRRAGIVRTVGGPVPTTERGRHAPYLHRWRLAVAAADAERFKASRPIPPDEPADQDTDDGTIQP
jgi:hypothetical protein